MIREPKLRKYFPEDVKREFNSTVCCSHAKAKVFSNESIEKFVCQHCGGRFTYIEGKLASYTDPTYWELTYEEVQTANNMLYLEACQNGPTDSPQNNEQ